MTASMKMLIATVTVVCVALPLATIWSARSARVELMPTSLAVGGGGYEVDVPYSSILWSEISVGESADSDLAWRTNGIGWPGFGLGWFRNAAGRKVFAYVASGEPVYIPTSLGFDIVISRDDPNGFLEALGNKAEVAPD